MDASKIAKKYQQPTENLLMDIAMLAKSKTDLIDLSIGDPDLITDQTIIEAAFSDAKLGHTKYTASDGSREFLQAVVEHYQKRYGLTFELNQVRATVGAMHGTYLALLAIINPGDEVIIHEPYFSPYKEQVEAAGGIPVFIPTYEKDGFQIDLTILEQAITDKTKAILV
ncbi:MAG TPA: aminotransferase class I/II-fold pyridoxal phosphate-dependent enzyme, partial [Enterococcus sp.]|nr:aminotransferase class I/II-fold pyridoxal phosphate-dependent enzyme [Enterococcus sp.]